MNTVRERILIDVAQSLKEYPWSEHRDLIEITVCAENFLDYEEFENEDNNPADFSEVIAIVDKDWLFDFMEMENPREYLKWEYTSDDSIEWYDEANRAGHLAMIAFS